MSTACPDREQIAGYLLGTLGGDRANRIGEHLAQCARCSATVADLDNVTDTVVVALREPEFRNPYLGEPEYWRALGQLRGLLREQPTQPPLAGQHEQTTGSAKPVVLGEYRVLGKLGAGGMGTVYKAVHTRLGRTVALKLLSQSRLGDRRAVARFEREMKAVGQLDHPNIIRAYDAREIDGQLVLVMEYVEGLDLAKIADRCCPMPIADACELVRQAAIGLQYVHEHGLVHRDIKPSNLILSWNTATTSSESGPVPPTRADAAVSGTAKPADGRSFSVCCVKVVDLGLAKVIDVDVAGTEITGSGEGVGTPDYMAPEQVTESHSVDIRADVYGLGCTLYRLLAGEVPFGGTRYKSRSQKTLAHLSEPPPPLASRRADVPDDLVGIVERAMSKRPEDRFDTPGALADAVSRFTPGSNLVALLRTSDEKGESTGQSLTSTDSHEASAISRTEPERVEPQPPQQRPQFLSPVSWPQRFTYRLRAIAAAVGLLAIVLAMGVTLLINKTRVIVPDGSKVTVNDNRSIDIETPMDPSFQAAPPAWIPARGGQPELGFQPPAVQVQRWLKTAPNIGAICLSRDSSSIYVAYWEDQNGSRIQAFSISSGELLRTICFGDHHAHGGLAVSPDGKYLFATNYYQAYISRIDLSDGDARTDLKISSLPGSAWAAGVALTPDGKTLAVALGADGRSTDENNDRVAIVNVARGSITFLEQVQLDDEMFVHNLAFAPDSASLYAVTRRRKSPAPTLCEISLRPPCRVSRSLLFPGGNLQGIAVAGRLQRAFVSDAGRKRVWSIDLQTLQPVSSLELGGHSPGRLVTDSAESVLAVTCPNTRKAFLFDLEDESLLASVSGLGEGASDLAFSRDRRSLFVAHRSTQGGVAVVDLESVLGNRIVFASNRGGESFQIYTTDERGTNPVRLTQNHATDSSPRWSPDGRRIAFVSDREGLPRIHIMNRVGKLQSLFSDTDPSKESSLDWSPDGQKIAFVGNENRAVRVVDTITGAVRTLIDGGVSPKHTHHWGVSWRTCDRSLFVNSQDPSFANHQDVFQINPQDSSVKQITGRSGQVTAPACSPDGRQLAFIRCKFGTTPSRDLVVINTDGTGESRVLSERDMDTAFLHWYPDGKRLLYCARKDSRNHLYSISIDGGKPVQLTTGEWDDIDPDICEGVSSVRTPSTRGSIDREDKSGFHPR